MSAPNTGVVTSKIKRGGNSHYLLVPKIILDQTTMREGSVVAIRVAGDKLIIERVALESLAIVRTGNVERAV